MEESSFTGQPTSPLSITSLGEMSSSPSDPGYQVAPSLPLLQICQFQYDDPLIVAPGGLSLDIWLCIIDIFKKDKMMLLAFALTCRALRQYAQNLINNTNQNWAIDPTTYDDINELAEVADSSLQNVKAIKTMTVSSSKSPKADEVALSIIPIKLSRKLHKINYLYLFSLENQTHFHASTWRLYGCAFSTVTELRLTCVTFPSFVDFASLVTSFPALSTLILEALSCRSQVIPLSISRAPKKCKLKLEYLCIQEFDNESENVWFVMIFCTWFAQIGGMLAGELQTSAEILIYTSSWGILESSQTNITSFRMMLNYKIHVRYMRSHVYQNLHKIQLRSSRFNTLELNLQSTTEIEVANLFLPYAVKNLKKLHLIWPYGLNDFSFYSFAWRILDTLLSAMYITKCMHYQIKIVLSIKDSSIADLYFSGSYQKMLRYLFPLTTSLGEGQWVVLQK